MTLFRLVLAKINQFAFIALFGLVIILLILPLPTVMIDVMIGLNIALAIVVVISALYVKNVLELSTFPSIVLLATMFRLSLGVASTRLILANGDAGHVIAAFGKFVVAGNVVAGLVIFFIIAIVQFLVVTKGSERIAEVIARFSLDAMPGKQMSIDADVRAGSLTVDEARLRRAELDKESHFFGAMDGAMRFVKGDAIAGLIIIFVNLIGGLLIGITQRGMSAGESFQTYTLLTVGDGLVAQIPSILIAMAAGMVVTRIVNEKADNIGSDIGQQLSSQPFAMAGASLFSFLLALVPGFPTLVFATIGTGLAIMTLFVLSRQGVALPFIPEKTVEIEVPNLQDNLKRDFIPTLPSPSLLLVGASELKEKLQENGTARQLNDAFLTYKRSIGVPMMLPGFETIENANGLQFQIEGERKLLLNDPLSMAPEHIIDQIMHQTRINAFRTVDAEVINFWKAELKERYFTMIANLERSTTNVFFADVVRRLLMHHISLRQPRTLLEALFRAEEFSRDPARVAEYVRLGLIHVTKADLRDQTDTTKLIILEHISPEDSAPFQQTDLAKINLRDCATSMIGKKLIDIHQEINTSREVIIIAPRTTQFGLQYFLSTFDIHAWVRLIEEIPEDAKVDVMALITSEKSIHKLSNS